MANIALRRINTAWTDALAASTDLDSKTDTTAIAAGAVITNGTALAILMDISLILGSLTPTTDAHVEAHLLPLTHDGTNYADRSTRTFVERFIPTLTASIKYMTLYNIEVPPGSFKLQLVNQLNVTTAASGNSCQYRLHDFNLNG